jgi:hypothetical protein
VVDAFEGADTLTSNATRAAALIDRRFDGESKTLLLEHLPKPPLRSNLPDFIDRLCVKRSGSVRRVPETSNESSFGVKCYQYLSRRELQTY